MWDGENLLFLRLLKRGFQFFNFLRISSSFIIHKVRLNFAQFFRQTLPLFLTYFEAFLHFFQYLLHLFLCALHFLLADVHFFLQKLSVGFRIDINIRQDFVQIILIQD